MDIPPYSSQTMAYYGLSMAPLHLKKAPELPRSWTCPAPPASAACRAAAAARRASGGRWRSWRWQRCRRSCPGGPGMTIHSYGKNGPSIVDLPGENGDLPGENGDLLGENGDLPGENGDFLWLC